MCVYEGVVESDRQVFCEKKTNYWRMIESPMTATHIHGQHTVEGVRPEVITGHHFFV